MKLYENCKIKRKIIHWGKIEKKRNLKEKKILKKHQYILSYQHELKIIISTTLILIQN